jgi:hypothetical protein
MANFLKLAKGAVKLIGRAEPEVTPIQQEALRLYSDYNGLFRKKLDAELLQDLVDSGALSADVAKRLPLLRTSLTDALNKPLPASTGPLFRGVDTTGLHKLEQGDTVGGGFGGAGSFSLDMGKAKGFANPATGFAAGGPVQLIEPGAARRAAAKQAHLDWQIARYRGRPEASEYDDTATAEQGILAKAAEDFEKLYAPLALSPAQTAYTAAHAMTRDDFLKKYGATFGSNAASEVAGLNVADYYDDHIGANRRTYTGQGEGDGFSLVPTSGNGNQIYGSKYWDAYDEVNPHPESQVKVGLEGFVDKMKPLAYMGALAYGAGFLPGAGAAPAAASPFSLSGGTASFGAASPATTASAMSTAAPGLTSAGLTGTLAAPGLAGMIGMESGKAATAVNTGALNTGVGLARGQKPLDALKSGVVSAALSPVGSYVSDTVGGGVVGKLAGNTAVGGLQGVATGRGLVDGAQQGLVAGGIDIAGDYMGGLARNATGNKFAGTAANSLTQSTLKGLPPGATLDSLATQYAAGEIKDLTGLDPKMAKIVIDLARNKKVSAVGALTALGSAADRAVGSRKLSRAAAGD